MKKYKSSLLILEVKTLVGTDLEYGQLPDNADDCEVWCEAEIGVKGEKAADIFSFAVVTPKFLWSQQGHKWGKGLIILDTFSWEAVEAALDNLLSQCSGRDWLEVTDKLTKTLYWEYENYKD